MQRLWHQTTYLVCKGHRTSTRTLRSDKQSNAQSFGFESLTPPWIRDVQQIHKSVTFSGQGSRLCLSCGSF